MQPEGGDVAATDDELHAVAPRLLTVPLRQRSDAAGMAVHEAQPVRAAGTQLGLGAGECDRIHDEAVRRRRGDGDVRQGMPCADHGPPRRVVAAEQGDRLGSAGDVGIAEAQQGRVHGSSEFDSQRAHGASFVGRARPGKGAIGALASAANSRHDRCMNEPLYGTPHAHGPLLGPLSPPLVRSTTAGQPDAETLRAMGAGERPGEFYQRLGHQNGRAFESLVASHEGADGAVAFASGMAAISGAMAAHLATGDRVLVAEEIYGGTSAFATTDLVRFGVRVDRFSALDLDGLRAQLQRPAKFVVFESPINPTLRVVDIAAVAKLARAAGALTLFDGTFAPPPVQWALRLGVDLVAHSATKFYGGHSDVLAGVVAGRHELLGPIEAWRRRTGAVLAPDPAWLLLRSWPTLLLRLQAQQEAALVLARGLADEVRAGRLVEVSYPGLPGDRDHELARRQMGGGGCVVTVEVAGGLPGARRAFDRLQRIARAPSLGGVESLATLPAFTTHASLTPAQRRTAGIADGLMRIAVGLEGADVLLGDVRQALQG